MESSENSKFDAIVIGSGIAGMMAATDLNYRGHRVLVLEHNHQAGGLMSGIWRRGFYFDVGCQSFENMGIIFPLLEQYGLGKITRFHRARYRLKMPEFDTIVYSLEQTKKEFQKSYPSMAQNFEKLFSVHQMTSDFCKRLFVPEYIPFVQKESVSAFLGWAAKALPWTSKIKTLMWDDFEDWYKSILPESGVRDLLSKCGYTRMNVFVASAFWHLWAEDYWYPEGGYQKWFDTWVSALESRGVEFQFKSTVIEFVKSGNKVVAVKNKKGQVFTADQIVYAGDYKQAVFKLIGEENFSASTIRKLKDVKHSDPLNSVYLGLNFPREKLKEILKSSHIFYFPNYKCRTEMDLNDIDAHKKAFLEITAHCLDDASLAPEGKSAVVLQSFTRCEWMDHWLSKGDWSQRSLEYKDLKKKVSEDLITVFEGIFPDVRKYIEYQEIGSPLSAYRFTRNELGGSCGFELNWRNYPFTNILAHTKTRFKNLHMAGHFTVWPGAVPTAALSGKIAAVYANKFMNKKSEKIKRKTSSSTKEAPIHA